MFIPLKDINPSRTYPIVNISLIIANIALFFYQLSLQFTLTPRAYAEFLSSYSTVPARLPAYLAGHGTFEMAFLPILTSMVLHSGFLHIAGNLLFLRTFRGCCRDGARWRVSPRDVDNCHGAVALDEAQEEAVRGHLRALL